MFPPIGSGFVTGGGGGGSVGVAPVAPRMPVNGVGELVLSESIDGDGRKTGSAVIRGGSWVGAACGLGTTTGWGEGGGGVDGVGKSGGGGSIGGATYIITDCGDGRTPAAISGTTTSPPRMTACAAIDSGTV